MILAPMQGLTELLFRRCYEQRFPGAFDSAVSPFLSLTHGNLADATDKIEDVLPENNVGSIPVVPQILGREPDEFVQLALRLGELGYRQINWNMGCPMRRVAGKRRGSGILPYPDEVRRVLDNVIPHIDGIALSVKMRLGYSQPDDIFRIIPVLNDYPILSVTIHPRTGRQQYGGSCDLERFAQALSLLYHPVIYNGDICTVDDYRHIRERFPQLADVMIGRGVLYDPLLPVRIRHNGKADNLSSEANIQFLQHLVGDILTTMPNEQAKLRKVKEYWCLMWRATGISEQASRKVLRSMTLDDTLRAIDEILLSLHTE